MIAVRATPDGATMGVRVAPGARAERIVGPYGDRLKVAVCGAPEKGKANRAVARMLAEALGVAPSSVALARGAASRDKVFLFRGLDAGALEKKIRALLVTLGPA